ncbi:MAG: lytic transglycosylase domain-containing protein [Burkholderiales bacterium]
MGFLGDLSIAQMLNAAAMRYGLDPGLVLAIAQRESRLNPNAVSRKGAKGVMQLMDATSADLGVTNPFDAAQNIDAGVRYLRQLLSQFGDLVKAVAAYNWGPGNLSAAISQHGENWLAAAPAETQAYVADILGITPMPLTIDAATGKPVESSVNVDALPYADQSTGISQKQIIVLTLLGLGAYFLADFLQE